MAANPYEAPRSRVADIQQEVEEFQDIRMWSASGRLGRLRYLAYIFGAWLIAACALGAIVAIAGSTAATVLMIVGYIALAVFGILVGIQRSHDMGWSGWTVLIAMLIPLAGLIWIFKAGTPGANEYGSPPPPNTTGVKALALIAPAIVIVGILAAIALPAYQQYVQRSQTQQQ
jgi:uncharacterized membrane protein YhaH (DUF805 family)